MELLSGEVRGLRSRRITDDTCKKFGYMLGDYKGRSVQIAPYYDSDGNLIAQKLRFQDKTFTVIGDIKDALPFGAQAFPKGGKKIVVTEGEIDALSMSQVQNNAWPVVSLNSGASSVRKFFATHQKYFNGFEEVVLMFDMDEPGRKAAREAAEVLGSRARIADLPSPFKDANEMLVAEKVRELIDSMWKAQPYRPEGIVDILTLEARVRERPKAGLSWWSPALTGLTYGKRLGELYAFGAGTGVGKTDWFTQDMAHMVTVLGENIGVFSLEQMITETATRIAGKIAQKTLHIPDSGWNDADIDQAWAKLKGSRGRVYLYDSFGANEWDVVKDKIEFLAHAEGVQWFYLDHLTALAAAEEDERTGLERIMSEMGAMVKRLNITIHFISHLATPDGAPHEEGGRVTIRQFKGSRAIGYWAHFMFGMERDQQADDPAERQVTTFRVLKDRYTGRATGETILLGYERETGLLYEMGERPPNEFKDETLEDTPTGSADNAGPSDF